MKKGTGRERGQRERPAGEPLLFRAEGAGQAAAASGGEGTERALVRARAAAAPARLTSGNCLTSGNRVGRSDPSYRPPPRTLSFLLLHLCCPFGRDPYSIFPTEPPMGGWGLTHIWVPIIYLWDRVHSIQMKRSTKNRVKRIEYKDKKTELKCIVHFSLLTWNHLDYTNQLKSSVNLDLKNISGISSMLS